MKNNHENLAVDLAEPLVQTSECGSVPVPDFVASAELLNRIKPRPLSYSLDAYWTAPGNDGPLAYAWSDKPHRLVYDLIAAVLYYAAQSASHQALVDALRPFAALLQLHDADGLDSRPIFGINNATITLGDMRRAATALAQAEKP